MLSNRRYKDLIWEQFAKVAKGMANPRRMEVLDLLMQAPRTVEVIARLAGLSVANASQHLQVLKGAALVETERRGNHIVYRIAGPHAERVFQSLRALGEARMAEVERLTRTFLEDRNLLQGVDQKALLAKVRRGEVTILDVRPAEEYSTGHIPGARSLPLEELKRRLAQLPRNREIVAYCRGPYCVLAVEAVTLLRSKGFKAHRLEAGMPDWSGAGLPVAVGGEDPRPRLGRSRKELP